MASQIEAYGLIGNTHTSALVSRSGSIDWLCAPRFDSDACFTALLGYDEHGRWALRPTVKVRESEQRYRDDTMILETEFTCDGGVARVIDFMPMGGRCDIVRIVEGVDGEVPLEMLLDVRFCYGADAPWIEKIGDGTRFLAGPDALILRSPLVLEQASQRVSAYLRVKKGDRIPIQLAWFAAHEEPPEATDVEQALASTESFWRAWSGRCAYKGRWRDAVVRSLITLKAMTYAPTGAIVAAPTTSLPEDIGGVRNWDYRFCWLRDATLTLDAFRIGGYIDEARAFRDWLLRAIAGNAADLQIMYNVVGGRHLTELELDWLPGYEGSKPVRVGNAASNQFQLDVFGETIGAVYQARQLGLRPHPDAFRSAKELIEYVSEVWQHPDDGIWEVRGGRKHFTYSKVMAWVAVDRAVRLLSEGGDPRAAHMLPWLRALRERIHDEVCQRGYHPRLNAFTQYY